MLCCSCITASFYPNPTPLLGGDLQLVSMPGYGVDAFLSLQHLEGDWQEPLAEHQSAPFEAEQAPLSAYP